MPRPAPPRHRLRPQPPTASGRSARAALRGGLLLGAGLLLLGCRASQAPADAAPPPHRLAEGDHPHSVAALTVHDDLDRPVRLPAPALRVLSLAPAATELVFALQRGETLVGRTEACDFPPEVAKIPSIGSLFPPDLERLLATAPDLVIMMDAHGDLRSRFEARGLPVFVHQPRTVDQALSAVGRLGTLLDARREAHILQTRMRQSLSALPPALEPRPAALYVIWGEPLTAVGGHTFLSDVLARSGLRNATGDRDEPWPQVSLERLVSLDPAVLVLGGAVDLTAPGWRDLSAVRAGRILRPADPDLLVRPGPRLVQGIAELAAAARALPATPASAPATSAPATAASAPAPSASAPATP